MSQLKDGPPNKWIKVSVAGMTSDQFLDLLNEEANNGFTQVVVRTGEDGQYAYFSNYNQ